MGASVVRWGVGCPLHARYLVLRRCEAAACASRSWPRVSACAASRQRHMRCGHSPRMSSIRGLVRRWTASRIAAAAAGAFQCCEHGPPFVTAKIYAPVTLHRASRSQPPTFVTGVDKSAKNITGIRNDLFSTYTTRASLNDSTQSRCWGRQARSKTFLVFLFADFELPEHLRGHRYAVLLVCSWPKSKLIWTGVHTYECVATCFGIRRISSLA